MATVTWCAGDSPAALWPAVLPAVPPGRVVVYVASRGRDHRVADTARSLIGFLREAAPSCRVEVLDPGADPGAWWPTPIIDLAAEPPLTVDAVRLPAGATVPALWLEPFFLVTVCRAAPDPRFGFAAALAAQAALLDGGAAIDLDLAYEAHRLLAADLNVACGSLRYRDPGSPGWWAASSSDVALEVALARAIGVSPERLPLLRHLARHELIDTRASSEGDVPALRGYLASAWRIRLRRARARAVHAARVMAGDVVAAAANLHRIPQFVRRRVGGAA